MMRTPSVDWRIDGSLMQTAAQLLGDESDAGHSSSSHNPLIKPPVSDSRPPTSNSLDVKQRNQLIRSTFKLSKVLGTTPQIAEEDLGEVPPSARRKLQRKSTLPGAPAIRRAVSANPPPSRPPTNLTRSKSIAAPVLRVNIEPVSRSSSTSTSSSIPPPSPSSPLFIVPSTAELKRQQTRAKLAKLQRHLGENIPAELVAPRPVPSPRRMSVDVSSLRKAVPNSLPKRSKSFWRGLKDPKEEGRDRSFSAQGSGGPMDKLPEEPLSERQKSINVRRAMKMAQVFGVPPPHDLFQITNASMTLDSAVNLGVYGPSAPNAKASIASLAYMLDHDRDSLYDLLSAPDPDPASKKLDAELEDAEPLDWPYERQAGTSTSSQKQVGIASSEAEIGEPSPPSAASVALLDISEYAAGSDPRTLVRRRRAAKLSRFFGVGYQDLFASMLSFPVSSAPPPPPPPLSPPRPPRTLVPTAVPETSKGATNVENLDRLAEEDIQNVMSRLRGLKAGA